MHKKWKKDNRTNKQTNTPTNQPTNQQTNKQTKNFANMSFYDENTLIIQIYIEAPTDFVLFSDWHSSKLKHF